MACGDVIRKKQTVDQQTQLTVLEVSIDIPVAAYRLALAILCLSHGLSELDVITRIDEVHQIAFDTLPVYLHLIFGFQQIDYLLLREPMFAVGIFA